MRGQNHYDTWYDSGRLGPRRALVLRSRRRPKACRDCHLPPYRSDEFGNQNG